MADKRKYREEEIEEILDLAITRHDSGRPAVEDEGGLTLEELQKVGLEVGVEPRRIAEAALTLHARRDALPRQRSLGLPISLGRIIELPRAMTDREWEILGGELRETFGARGRIRSHGSVREWTNGNLHAFLEPTETGHRLRLGTRKGGAKAQNRMGAIGLAMGLTLLTVFLTTNVSPVALEIPMLLLTAAGGGTLALNMLRLPPWAREREGQMEYIAGRVSVLIGEGQEEDDSEG